MYLARDYYTEKLEGMQGNIVTHTEALAEGYTFYQRIYRVDNNRYIDLSVNTKDESLKGLWLVDNRKGKDYYHFTATSLVYVENITEDDLLDTDLFIKYCGGWN